MNTKNIKRTSKLMSLALRHQPDALGLTLDAHGWADTTLLIQALNAKSHKISLEDLKIIVSENDKKRFSFNDDFSRIRANQGHSIQVDVELKVAIPPHTLYHGTVGKFMQSIMQKGIVKGTRQHVHLSEDLHTAKTVGSRRGVPTILKVNTHKMHLDGFTFFLSENDVWLTDHVPAEYIEK